LYLFWHERITQGGRNGVVDKFLRLAERNKREREGGRGEREERGERVKERERERERER
jgi:hypothetical protein